MMLKLAVLSIVVTAVSAYSQFRDKIPNGQLIKNPCNTSEIWQGVGHFDKYGGGPRNPFGLDFAANNFEWTWNLCHMDSDRDGTSNGAELGDRLCLSVIDIDPYWRRDPGPPTGHPGICEPPELAACQEVNGGDICRPSPPPPARTCLGAVEGGHIRRMDLRFRRTIVPAQRTSYYCQLYKFPVDRDYHITADKPIVRSQRFLHHMVLYACPDSSALHSQLEAQLSTTEPRPCGMMIQEVCPHIIAGWARGGTGDCYDRLPAATRIGRTAFKIAVLEVHWDNQDQITGHYDAPGLSVFLSTQLRPHDLAVLTIGNTAFRIPRGENRFEVNATCPGRCTQQKFGDVPYINVVSAGVHMHLTGRKASTMVLPSKVYLANENKFTYNAPSDFNHDTPIRVNRGDSLQVKCVFSTRSRRNSTYYGPATSDEMCYSYITYYPKIDNFALCLSYGTTPHCDGEQLLPRVGNCDLSQTDQALDCILWKLETLCDTTGSNCWDDCYRLLKMSDVRNRNEACYTGDARGYIEYTLSDTSNDNKYLRAFRSCDDNNRKARTFNSDPNYATHQNRLADYNGNYRSICPNY